MLRPSFVAAAVLVLASSAVATASGCHLIAGIEEKKLDRSPPNPDGGAGGAGGAGGGASGGAGGGAPTCGLGAVANPMCAAVECNANTSKDNNECNCGICYHDCGG